MQMGIEVLQSQMKSASVHCKIRKKHIKKLMDDDMLLGRSTTNPVISHTPSTKRRFVVYGMFDYMWREKGSYREIMREQFFISQTE